MTQHIPSSLKETSMADQNVTQLANKHTDQLGLIIKDETQLNNKMHLFCLHMKNRIIITNLYSQI